MAEEADASDYGRMASAADGGEEGDEGGVLEWEIGLPSGEDLTPLSQSLVPPELASAFNISPEPARTILDVHRASHSTVSILHQHRSSSAAATATALRSFPPFPSPAAGDDDPMILEGDDPATEDGATESSRKVRRTDPPPSSAAVEEADSSAFRPDNSNDDQSSRTLKRSRLVWTPRLHKRFVDVVAHLGIKRAVPKTIMQLMNVGGLTRENVASHLQKYRLYLKRMQGLSNEGPSSSSDHLFATTPVPPSLQDPSVQMPIPYAVPTMISMPVFGMTHHGNGSPVGMVPVNNHQGSPAYHGFESYHTYGAFGEHPKDWSDGNNYGSIVSNHHATHNDK